MFFSVFFVPTAKPSASNLDLSGVSLPFCQQKPSMFDVSREMGSSVALYSRKVLIQTKATDILPKWLRFLRGLDPPACLQLLFLLYSDLHDFMK